MKSSASAPSRATSIRLTILLLLNPSSANSTSLGLSSTNKISTPLSLICILSPVQCKIECCTTVNSTFSPDTPTMTANNTLHGCQTHPGAFEVFCPVQALEDAKQFAVVLHIKA